MTLDKTNMAELTKGGQPRTAMGQPPDAVPPTPPVILDGVPGWRARRAILVTERGHVAYETALALGYGSENAEKFRQAAMDAAKTGLAPSGTLFGAGRVRLGTAATFGGVVVVMSILLDSGATFDPTRVSDPGNNSVGSD